MTPAELIEIRKQGMKPQKEVIISLLKKGALEGDTRPIIEVGTPDGIDWRGVVGLDVRILFYNREDDALNIAIEIFNICRTLYFGNMKKENLLWIKQDGSFKRLLWGGKLAA